MSPVRRPWLFTRTPDVLGLLREQVRITGTLIGAFAAWSAGDDEADAAAVRVSEHDGDAVRRALIAGLREVLSAPLDQEDLYVIADRLDAVQNIAKNAVRQAQVAGWVPDAPAARMAACATDAVGSLVRALEALPDRADDAGTHADAAIRAARGIEKEYRRALAGLAASSGPAGSIVVTADLYRRYCSLGDALIAVCHRVWFSVLKEE